jgi:hypothetical protein
MVACATMKCGSPAVALFVGANSPFCERCTGNMVIQVAELRRARSHDCCERDWFLSHAAYGWAAL